MKNSRTEISCTRTTTPSIEGIKTENEQFTSKVSEITSNGDSSKAGLSSPKNSKCSYNEHMRYFQHFTPKMWKLYKVACILKKKQESVSRKHLSFHQRIRQAKQYSKSPAIEKLLCSLTPTQRTFIEMQMRALKCQPKDRYFTLDEKIAALSIMKQSSKYYEYLTQVFDLPSTYTLWPILQKINIHPGPINFINQRLKEEVRMMKQKDKLCILMWDEMLLQPHLDYDMKKKHIIGFEDFGGRRNALFVDHALVFMVRGIQSGWKLPLAYYFCDGATKTDQLVKWIKTVSTIIIDSGLNLVAFVCKDGKRDLAAVNKLKLEAAKQMLRLGERYCGDIIIKNRTIIPLYNPPCLIKGIRNNLLNYDLEFDCAEEQERKFASWQIIEQAYHMDLTHSMYRLMPKITTEHVIKDKVSIKKVKHAAQVLSMTMGGFIHHHTKLEGQVNTIHGPLRMPEKEGRDTADMILFFDRLFDSVNGYTLKPEKSLRVVVSHDSPHSSFWGRAAKRLRRMRFVDPTDKKPLKESVILKNWISTIEGFRRLWKVLRIYKFKYFKPRILNQDSLANFFGQIRSLGERNVKPTCSEFESSFKMLLLGNLASGCTEKDNSENKTDGPLLFTLKEFISFKVSCMNNDTVTENLMLDLEMTSSDATENNDSMFSSITERILNNSHVGECEVCKNLISDSAKSELAPSKCLLKVLEDADNILAQRMSSVCYLHHTALMLETELYMSLDLRWLNCQQHRNVLKELVVSYTVVFYISKWCNGINEILMGKEDMSL
ncbi:uncharacterized protein LOC105184438 isoform X2 [Harpegnathos saltator]|nr:uncharacterized protein LOC105184438 isoform X2 [Harpegnathos saltator]